MRYLIETKRRSFVPGLIYSQLTVVYVKLGSIDWLEMSPEQICVPFSQRDISGVCVLLRTS